MTDHDDLCHESVSGHTHWICECDLIAKARADERERVLESLTTVAESERLEAVRADERERIAAAIEKCGTQDSAGVFWIWVDAAARIARDGGGNG